MSQILLTASSFLLLGAEKKSDTERASGTSKVRQQHNVAANACREGNKKALVINCLKNNDANANTGG